MKNLSLNLLNYFLLFHNKKVMCWQIRAATKQFSQVLQAKPKNL